MDNIGKLMLGVLGVAGLLTMLVPSGVPTVQPSVAAVATVEPSIVEQAVVKPNPEPEFASEDYATFQFGQPTIDGKPIVDGETAELNNGNPGANTNLAQNADSDIVAQSPPSPQYVQPVNEPLSEQQQTNASVPTRSKL